MMPGDISNPVWCDHLVPLFIVACCVFRHEVADVAGLTSFSFGEDEVDRYVMVWKKVSPPQNLRSWSAPHSRVAAGCVGLSHTLRNHFAGVCPDRRRTGSAQKG